MTSLESNQLDEQPMVDVDSATTTIEIDSGSFPVLDVGEGPVVVLLHGFPDSRHLWRYQVPALTEAGFRVVAPDLRGFGDAPRPESVEAYSAHYLVDDVMSILDTLDIQNFRLVGHDWGAAIAWRLAATEKEAVEQMVALSVGAPGNSGKLTVEQRERTWYVYLFKLQDVAEAWLKHDDWKLFREWMRGDGDQERYMQDLSREGALTAALNPYRALDGYRTTAPDKANSEYEPVICPALGIWSDGDHYITEQHMTGSEEMVEGPWSYEKITGASHWMMLEKPSKLNDLLLNFFTNK